MCYFISFCLRKKKNWKRIECISFAHVGEPAYRWILYNSYVHIHERFFNYAMYMSVSWDIVGCIFSLRSQRVYEPVFSFFFSRCFQTFGETELNWTKQKTKEIIILIQFIWKKWNVRVLSHTMDEMQKYVSYEPAKIKFLIQFRMPNVSRMCNENYSSCPTRQQYQVSHLLCSKSQNSISKQPVAGNMNTTEKCSELLCMKMKEIEYERKENHIFIG